MPKHHSLNTRLTIVDMSAALTRTMKSLNQRQVLVDSACETVLFVSNWPPAYGEDELMALFEKVSDSSLFKITKLT